MIILKMINRLQWNLYNWAKSRIWYKNLNLPLIKIATYSKYPQFQLYSLTKTKSFCEGFTFTKALVLALQILSFSCIASKLLNVNFKTYTP